MEEKRTKFWRWMMIGFAVIALCLPTAYVTGYFALGRRVDWYKQGNGITVKPTPGSALAMVYREYSAPWQASLFLPASKAEAALAGVEVKVGSR